MPLIMIPMIIQAVEVTIDGIKYSIIEKAKFAIVISNNYSGNIVIPSSIEYEDITYDVTTIGSNAFGKNCKATSITIPNSITTMENNAFYVNYNLKKVIVNDLAAWCRISFSNEYSNPLYCAYHLYSDENTEIKDLIIPEGVDSIEDRAFIRCTALTSINIPTSVKNIGASAFQDCTALTTINSASSVTDIGASAFQGCTGLTYIDIPTSVTNIGASAFKGCTNLISINIPNSVKTLGESTFSGCKNLSSIDIPSSVTYIADNLFVQCEKLSSVNIPQGVTKIGAGAFTYCINLTSINIPNSVTSIGNSAFSTCYILQSITIPNSVISIGESAFLYCNALTSITIPNSVTSIGSDAFNCPKVESVIIGEGISTIKLGAFNCPSLKNLEIGSNVKSIEKNNFYNCKNLETVKCKAVSVPQLTNPWPGGSNDVFSNCYIEYAKLIVPDESIDAYKAAAVWKNFGTIEGFGGTIPQTEKCATPTIHYANGQLTFECETEGVTYQTTITSTDVNSYYSNTINLTGKYLVKVYATKQGFDNSDPATAEINLLEGSGSGIKGDVNNDKYVNMSDVTDIINIILGKEQ